MTPPTVVVCPCCASTDPSQVENGHWFACRLCRHRWRTPATLTPTQYGQQQNRNLPGNPYLQRKTADRLQAVLPYVADGARILEVGCAEGQLGQAVKQARPVVYEGVELSQDRKIAATCLDAVHAHGAEQISGSAAYDLILSFHVLEHIENVDAELNHWLRLLKPEGTMLIEVPNRSGHPDLATDAHPEHLHQFALTSLVALLGRLGLDVLETTSGHFESPVYYDSLRAVVKRTASDEAKRQRLVARFLRTLGGQFRVYGVGGDFRNYVLPIIQQLPIAGLLDSAPGAAMAVPGFSVERFDLGQHADLPILVSSLRFKQEIANHLQAQGVPANHIFGLDDVFGTP